MTATDHEIAVFTSTSSELGRTQDAAASLALVERQAARYRFVGLHAIPLVVEAERPRDLVDAVARVSAGFRLLHLEGIRSPACFLVARKLEYRTDLPLFHNDQLGAATVVLAAVMKAARIHALDPRQITIGQLGVGAAGASIVSMLGAWGASRILIYDADRHAEDRINVRAARRAGFEELLRESDIVIAATGRGGLIPSNRIRPKQVVLCLSTPTPEIAAAEAMRRGAALAADAATLDSALAFPGLVKALLDSDARSLPMAAVLEAASVIASYPTATGWLPDPSELALHERVSEAVRRHLVTAMPRQNAR